MKKNKLGKTNIEVTPIGMGVLTIGNTQLNLSLKDGAKIVEYALSKGINFLDTAEYYETYPYIKEALKDNDFNPVIASKSLCHSYEDMEKAISDALIAMDLEYIDIFMLHEVRHGNDFKSRHGAWECLIDAKKSGRVKAIGVSTHHTDVAMNMANIPECDILFPLINKDSLGIRTGENQGTRNEMEKAIEACVKAGIGVFAMKVFGGGNLTASYMECMNYVSSLSGIDSIMIGFGNEEEIDRAIEYAQGQIPADYVPDISNKKITIDSGDCEGCGICIERCPNMAIFRNKDGIAQVDHNICLTCGYCAPVCPVRAIIMF